MIEGGADAAGQGAGRVIDVQWAAPTWDGAAISYPADAPAQGFAFGSVRLTTARATDWACFVQPMRVLRAPDAYWPTPTTGPPPVLWQQGREPGPWWPEGSAAARSPFVLETTSGPEEGVIQRVPIPARGICVALRGANVSAIIRYDRTALGTIPPPPYEVLPGPQARGWGQMRLVLTPARPASRYVAIDTRRVNVGPIAAAGLPGWLPAFAARMVPTVLDPFDVGWRTPTGQFIGNTFESQIPHAAVAFDQGLGDPGPPRAIAVEVFA